MNWILSMTAMGTSFYCTFVLQQFSLIILVLLYHLLCVLHRLNFITETTFSRHSFLFWITFCPLWNEFYSLSLKATFCPPWANLITGFPWYIFSNLLSKCPPSAKFHHWFLVALLSALLSELYLGTYFHILGVINWLSYDEWGHWRTGGLHGKQLPLTTESWNFFD